MRIEIAVLLATAVYAANWYYGGYYTRLFWSFLPYYKMVGVAAAVIAVVYMFRTKPMECSTLLKHAHRYIMTSLPIQRANNLHRHAGIAPLFDLSGPAMSAVRTVNLGVGAGGWQQDHVPPPVGAGMGGMGGTGGAGTRLGPPVKRSVSETKKRYVAASQSWRCGMCGEQLSHTYEIDHRVRLERGGTNEVDNLWALCRECHAKKTSFENM